MFYLLGFNIYSDIFLKYGLYIYLCKCEICKDICVIKNAE